VSKPSSSSVSATKSANKPTHQESQEADASEPPKPSAAEDGSDGNDDQKASPAPAVKPDDKDSQESSEVPKPSAAEDGSEGNDDQKASPAPAAKPDDKDSQESSEPSKAATTENSDESNDDQNASSEAQDSEPVRDKAVPKVSKLAEQTDVSEQADVSPAGIAQDIPDTESEDSHHGKFLAKHPQFAKAVKKLPAPLQELIEDVVNTQQGKKKDIKSTIEGLSLVMPKLKGLHKHLKSKKANDGDSENEGVDPFQLLGSVREVK